ncbi:trehalose phosphate synthase [Diplocarpon rosae]|nr:trehalose phosphate synthase [Diplocarpon rosae]
MTVFVVSLFLPNTITFTLPTSAPRARPSPPRRTTTRIETSAGKPSLFAQQRHLTPPQTPIADADDDGFFAPNENAELRGPFPKPGHHPRSLISPSDPHSPAWGAGRLLNQPRSRASSPPPADIRKHHKTVQKAKILGRAGVRQPQLSRSESHDRVFAHAEWTVVPADQGNGGLRNAVQAAVRNGKLHDKTWVGTLGMPTDALEETQQKQDIEDRLATEYDSLTVFCKDSDFDGHYTHYCKQILWPVFHYQIPDNPKSKAYEDHSWIYYVAVNQAFADKLVKNWKRGDVIWVHDYHLLLVPSMVRKKLPDAQIGFFLHVAFPSSEVFRCLAVRKELLEGMLGANLIGFQIHEYARHFLQTCSRLLCVEATNDGVQLEDRFVDVFNLAIGIDPVALDVNRADPDVAEWLETMRDRYRGKKLIVARDKLDHPLVYLKQDISYPQYLALLTVADALMITSQREGMNLTCHEYLFCQDGKLEGHDNQHGSLILSEFTGSASVFGGSELSVNPWDYRQCADAIKQALEMGDEEKKTRWDKLYTAIMHHTAEHWFTAFLTRLDRVYEEQHRRDTTAVPRLSIHHLGRQYQASARRLFLLDYEGTLASWGSPNDIILTSPQRTLDVLNDLLQDERNTVYVMSGRQPEELDRLFKRVPNLGLIAENGCFLQEFGTSKWIEMADPDKMRAWKESVEGIMQYYHERTPGSRIETRHCSLIFHFQSCEDQESASRQAGDCASHINDACEEQRVRAVPTEGPALRPLSPPKLATIA